MSRQLAFLLTPVVLAALGVFVAAAVQQNKNENQQTQSKKESAVEPTSPETKDQTKPSLKLATFGAGCFWCVEAVFDELDGVVSVESGYSGGKTANPTYQQVCNGDTGHAEVCRIQFDPSKIGFDELLEVFWQTHDPTTLNRQGGDFGTQYRSAIFYHDQEQKQLAEEYKKKLDASGAFDAPIVTEISSLKNYYSAEGYHQNYFKENPGNGYCSVVIAPKLEKLRKVFKKKLKKK